MFLNAAYSKKFSREVDTILTEPTTTEILGPVEGLKFVKGS
jgi:hypothetical protein